MTQPDPTQREPLRKVSLITGGVSTALGLAVAFGLPLTATQRDSILSAIPPIAVIVVWVWGRLRVYSPARVHALLNRKSPGPIPPIKS